MTLANFEFFVGTKIVFGKNASHQVGAELASRGFRKTMIVTDKGITNAGLLENIIKSIQDQNIGYVVFDEVPPNPPIATVVKGLEIFRSNECDSFVAVGGGSSMDACKSISMMTTNDGSIIDYDIGGRTFQRPGKAVITIPTTSGTGSEVTKWAVITDEKRNWKASIGSPYMAPVAALVDPALTLGLPPHITAATGVDALTHAIEAYTTKMALSEVSPITDNLALQAIRLISSNLRQAYAQGENYEAREKTMLGSMIAGMAFPQVGLGNTHALAHPLSGYYDVPHGVANAALLQYVMKFNLNACPDRFASIAEAMGENITGLSQIEAAEKAVAAVARMVRDTNIPLLSSFGVKEEDWKRMAEDAVTDINCKMNPRKTTLKDLIELYAEANRAE
jgi:alcohol dehydrogenase class IV